MRRSAKATSKDFNRSPEPQAERNTPAQRPVLPLPNTPAQRPVPPLPNTYYARQVLPLPDADVPPLPRVLPTWAYAKEREPEAVNKSTAEEVQRTGPTQVQGNGAPDIDEPEAQVVVNQGTPSKSNTMGSGAPIIDLGQQIQQLLQQQMKQDQEERKALEQRNMQLEQECVLGRQQMAKLHSDRRTMKNREEQMQGDLDNSIRENYCLMRDRKKQLEEIARLKQQLRQIQDIVKTWKLDDD